MSPASRSSESTTVLEGSHTTSEHAPWVVTLHRPKDPVGQLTKTESGFTTISPADGAVEPAGPPPIPASLAPPAPSLALPAAPPFPLALAPPMPRPVAALPPLPISCELVELHATENRAPSSATFAKH